MTITVKINPPDGNRQTACELIRQIAANSILSSKMSLTQAKKISQAVIRSSFTATIKAASATKSTSIETVAKRNERHTEEFTWATKSSNSRTKNSVTFE